MPLILEDADQNLSCRLRRLLEQLWQEWKSLEEQIQRLRDDIESIARQDDACQRLLTVPGVGPLVATALIASVGNGTTFRKGREFAAWLGLVPRQFSTGGKATDTLNKR
jgi:transposase